MPLTKTAEKVKRAMQRQYGPEKGEQVFYATAKKKGGEPEKASTWKKGGTDTTDESEEYVVSQDTEVILNGHKYLLEKGDIIRIKRKPDAGLDEEDMRPADIDVD